MVRRAAWILRRLLVGEAADPDDLDQRSEVGVLHGRPVRRRAGGEPDAAPALGWRLGSIRSNDAVGRDRPAGRIGRTERLEGSLRVQVGGVLGQDREHQLAHRVQSLGRGRDAVEVAQPLDHEFDEPGPAAPQVPRPGDRGVDPAAGPGAWLGGAAAGRLGRDERPPGAVLTR